MDEIRARLLADKLGELMHWSKPEVEDTVGPYDPAIFDEVAEQLHVIIDACKSFLAECSNEEISLLVDHDRPEGGAALRLRWREFMKPQIDDLYFPPWMAGGFGHPDYAADFEHWTRVPKFTTEEILALSVGVEPGKWTVAALEKLEKKDPSRIWPSLRFLLARWQLIRSTFGRGSVSSQTVDRFQLLLWLERMDLEAPPEFLAGLQLRCGRDTTMDADGVKPPDKREVDTIAQLFVALAIDGYGFNPRQARSPIPKEISNIAATLGLSISDDTVRKYLRQGAKFIPKDWQPE